MSMIRVSSRMKPYCCVQVWRIKLVLSVVVVLFTAPEAEGMSIADGIEISDITGSHKQLNAGTPQTESRHRIRMLFPLLLNISSRLAQIVPMALTATLATFLMALLAKKALLISLATFGLVIYDKLKKKTHILHYHVKPSHKNYLTDKYYVRDEPHKYAVYSDEYHSAHTHKYDSGHNLYDDGSDFILQNNLADTSKWYQKDAMGM